jgi:hypothetical protein
MSARKVVFAVLALALATTTCQASVQEPAGFPEEDAAAIWGVFELYTDAMLANDHAAVAAHWAEDAV